MHRHRRFRHGRPFFGPRWHFGGMIWFFIIAMMFFGGRAWPIILILVGVSILLGGFFREERPQEPPPPAPPSFIPMAPRFDELNASPATPRYAPASVEPIHRADLLPTHCPNCGGPVRSIDVKWTGAQSAACSYCGSNLPMKKG